MDADEPLTVLLVEDNEIDAKLALRAARRLEPALRMEHVVDGDLAIERLRREGRFAGMPWIGLVLLDLQLPRMSGHEVLQTAKSDPELRRIPIVVLTSSSDEEDVRSVYEERAAAFLTKPVDFESLSELMETTVGFWTKVRVAPGA